MGLTLNLSNTQKINNFKKYSDQFEYQDQSLYNLLFERNQDLIKSKKVAVASANLKKVFESTFKLSAKIGFHEMSLRDLSKDTGLSMGGLYSCLTKKEDIALMVLDIVELVSEKNNQAALKQTDELQSLETAIRSYLYSGTILQPWFFFLYFETRSLSPENQIKSKNIELNTIATLEKIIQSGVDKGIFDVNSPYFVSSTILIVLQDWYLKPWKNKAKNIDLEQYSTHLFRMTKKLLRI
jgi:AcrR family transcriptional regulator